MIWRVQAFKGKFLAAPVCSCSWCSSVRLEQETGSCGKKVDDVSGRSSLLPQSSHSVSYASTVIREEETATSSPLGDQILMAGVKVSHVRIVVM
ncbi:hypothetical protein Bca52824_035746 [Brassica carinata]|uniref:Uncharacterized protein n=1 Tax=Brassica carinata TaxID=52824 RepID=A0A8X7S831_BRACI|nr:hypothetical protein Bca52824_035746 [Brassica carinata]